MTIQPQLLLFKFMVTVWAGAIQPSYWLIFTSNQFYSWAQLLMLAIIIGNPCLIPLFERTCSTDFYTEYKLILTYALIGATW